MILYIRELKKIIRSQNSSKIGFYFSRIIFNKRKKMKTSTGILLLAFLVMLNFHCKYKILIFVLIFKLFASNEIEHFF